MKNEWQYFHTSSFPIRMMSIKYNPWVLVVAVFTALAIAVFLAWYLFGLIQEKSTIIIAAKEKLASFETRRIALKREGQRLETLLPVINAFRGVFLQKENPLTFIEFLEEMARRTGTKVEIKFLGAISVPDALQFDASTFLITFVGSPSNVNKILPLIESMPYQGVIGDIDVQLPPEDEAKITMSLKVFVTK